MSFFSNNNGENCPGIINQNPLNGLNEKICIEVKRVFDACVKKTTEELAILVPIPSGSSNPKTFVSARSIKTKGKIKNLQILNVADNPCLHRIKMDVTVPVEVIYVDECGSECCVKGEITIPQDTLLCLPCASVIPYEIESSVSCVCPEGKYTSGCFNVTACLTVINKVVVETQILVPSYGYCPLPPCQDYSEEVCSGFFDLPIYPTFPKCN